MAKLGTCFPARIHIRVGTNCWKKLVREGEPEKSLVAREVFLAYSTSTSVHLRGVCAELGKPEGE